MGESISEVEFDRAKNAMMSNVMMQVEVRGCLLEDLGTRYLLSGQDESLDEFVAKVKAVTIDDVLRVARKMLGSTPSIVAVGDLTKFPSDVSTIVRRFKSPS